MSSCVSAINHTFLLGRLLHTLPTCVSYVYVIHSYYLTRSHIAVSPPPPSTSFYSIYHIFTDTNFHDSLTLAEKFFIQVWIVRSVWLCCKLYTFVCYLLSLRFC